jgi:hypothetical protein
VIVASAYAQMAATLQNEVDVILIKPVSYRQLCDLAGRFYADATRDCPPDA